MCREALSNQTKRLVLTLLVLTCVLTLMERPFDGGHLVFKTEEI